MMQDELLNPLVAINDSCEALLDESGGMLTVQQERVVSAISGVNRMLYDLLISLPDVTSSNAQGLLSYETRSHLTSIIGYAEMLLDETEGPLTAIQGEYAQTIYTYGTHLLALVAEFLDGST